jgi:hypothetical protein
MSAFHILTPDSWSAVARGAAVKGLETQDSQKKQLVANRKCRRYYGTVKNSPFVKGKHKESEANISSFDGKKRARNQMDWLLQKGQDLSTSKPAHAKLALHTTFWPGEKRQSTLRLMASNKEQGPMRSTDEVCIAHYEDQDISLTFTRVYSKSPRWRST